MKFSIVIPAYNSEKSIGRTLVSLATQSVPKEEYEIVVVDDASRDNTLGQIRFYESVYPQHNWKIIEHKENMNKAITRNDGMKAASGEWICWLDADDFYLPFYLEIMSQAIEMNPDKMLFYFGGIVTWKRWDMGIRPPTTVFWKDVFRSGGIMSGGFIFKKECLSKVGYLPAVKSPYHFGDAILSEFPEVKPLYKPGQLDLGNPWGDDWAMFYKLTREYPPHRLNVTPYVVVNREEHHL